MSLKGSKWSSPAGSPSRSPPKAGYLASRQREVPLYTGTDREFFIDNLLVWIHRCFWWTGLAPWGFEFPFPGSLISTFLGLHRHTYIPPSVRCRMVEGSGFTGEKTPRVFCLEPEGVETVLACRLAFALASKGLSPATYPPAPGQEILEVLQGYLAHKTLQPP